MQKLSIKVLRLNRIQLLRPTIHPSKVLLLSKIQLLRHPQSLLQPTSLLTHRSASNKLTNDEYSQLAAKAAGVAIGLNGKPAFTSYEQSMNYAEALTNLHKSGIDRNSTPQEIAAASVGTKLDQNGKPIISNVTQGQNYGNALKNYGLKTYTATVNSIDVKASPNSEEKNYMFHQN